MDIIKIKDNIIPKLDTSIACIGFFDGVHIGHQKLIKETIKQAKEYNVKSCLICFDPDPLDVVCNCKNNHLTSFKDRLNIIEYFGIQQVIVIEFDEKLMNLSPSKFIHDYLEKFNIIKLICGYDFTFGYKAKGNTKLLLKNKKFECIVVPECSYRKHKVSSSYIKKLFIEGKFKLVNKLLGWNYCLRLIVVESKKDGNRYIVKCKLKDRQGILPQPKQYADSLIVDDKYVYIKGESKLNKGQIVYLDFSNE